LRTAGQGVADLLDLNAMTLSPPLTLEIAGVTEIPQTLKQWTSATGDNNSATDTSAPGK